VDPFLGEIRLFSFGFAPRGWAFCNGQLLAINQNQALFSILGTMYGGNGITTFALPDLRGRVPVNPGSGILLGEKAGEEAHTLSVSEIPSHIHQALASTSSATTASPNGNVWAGLSVGGYINDSAPDVSMNPGALAPTGASAPHSNMQPYNVFSFCIAITGIFPSRN
jgi:microcystin-dependent protein